VEPPAELELHRAAFELTVVLRGEVDVANAPELTERIQGAILERPDPTLRVLLRMDEVTLFATAGVALVVRTLERVAAIGGSLVLVGPSEPVRHVLDTCSLTKSLDIRAR
jgi:anti-anti-sigma factor